MVEHSAVNRVVVGSSPTRGVLSTALRKFGYQRIGIYARRYLGLSGLIVYYQAALSVNDSNSAYVPVPSGQYFWDCRPARHLFLPSAGYAGILTGDAFARINTQRY